MKADLAIYSHILGVSGHCWSVTLMLCYKMDFSSCAIKDSFGNPVKVISSIKVELGYDSY